jgi:proline iminopeptidase
MRVPANGADLHYTTRGDGPACLVLCSIDTKPYERQMPPTLSERLRLAFVDLRGSGRSTGEPETLTFDVLAEDLEAVRIALGVERVAVLGHSILGALAIEHGRRRPASVSHVIAVGTPPRWDMARLAPESAAFFARDASEERKRLLRENLASLPKEAPPGQIMFARTPMRFFDPRSDAAPLFAGAEAKPRFLAHLMGPLTAGWDVLAASVPLRVPLLIALGRHDYEVPHHLWEGVAPGLPDATLRLFGRSGHQPFVDEPEAFAEAVAEWMASRP